MSTFLTQGLYSNTTTTTVKSNHLKVPPAASENLTNALLHAPFVKPTDKIKKDVAELSLSDFQPKRFALNYDPPMISKSFIK